MQFKKKFMRLCGSVVYKVEKQNLTDSKDPTWTSNLSNSSSECRCYDTLMVQNRSVRSDVVQKR